MTITTGTPVVAIHDDFYALTRPFGIGPLGEEVAAVQIPLGDQQPQPTRRIPLSVLDALLESGDAAFVDVGPLRAAMRRLARRETELEMADAGAKPSGKGAVEKLLRLLKSGEVRSAAALLDPGDALETV